MAFTNLLVRNMLSVAPLTGQFNQRGPCHLNQDDTYTHQHKLHTVYAGSTAPSQTHNSASVLQPTPTVSPQLNTYFVHKNNTSGRHYRRIHTGRVTFVRRVRRSVRCWGFFLHFRGLLWGCGWSGFAVEPWGRPGCRSVE